MRLLPALGLSLALVCQGASAAPPVANHPIIGVWKLVVAEGRCAETYRFRGDGTSLITSAHEVSETEFLIPATPSEKGFYKLEDKVVKDNGKQDCSGDIIQVGTKVTNFVRFHPSGEIFLMCASESMEECIGPFERVRGEDI
ncbi:MAG: hypothetical protein JWQ01_3264 [Massilia sp.]|jgi:hypothetical protein|nr:hypothetical protein [Massilia sp.]